MGVLGSGGRLDGLKVCLFDSELCASSVSRGGCGHFSRWPVRSGKPLGISTMPPSSAISFICLAMIFHFASCSGVWRTSERGSPQFQPAEISIIIRVSSSLSSMTATLRADHQPCQNKPMIGGITDQISTYALSRWSVTPPRGGGSDFGAPNCRFAPRRRYRSSLQLAYSGGERPMSFKCYYCGRTRQRGTDPRERRLAPKLAPSRAPNATNELQTRSITAGQRGGP